ncbi:MAG TPA: hypothetical protein VIM12_18355 [Noviherbaspirillum sp.]|jgi:hypothetical protein|uniref:hypothetical protein n=1 Tax=Noviherbaspirillum sp. TaxID=1926288 RepID=UPI002F92CD2F
MQTTRDQGQLWKKIADAYQQWDGDRARLMGIDDLSEILPDLDPDEIEQALARAHAEGKVAGYDGRRRFRLVPNH